MNRNFEKFSFTVKFFGFLQDSPLIIIAFRENASLYWDAECFGFALFESVKIVQAVDEQEEGDLFDQ